MGSGGPETVTQINEPPAYVQPYLEDLAKNSAELYERGGLAPVAGFDPAQRRAQQSILDFVYSPRTAAGLDTARGSLDQLLRASDINNNPAVQGLLDSQSNLITQAFQEQVLPSITGEAVLSGGVGGSRQGVAQGLAAGRTSQAIGDASTQILSNAYSQGLRAQAQGLALAPTINQLPLQLFGAAEAVGGQRRNLDQLQQMQPQLALEELGRLLGLSTGGGGVQTQTTTGGSNSPIASAFGGAAAGAGLAAELFPAFAAAGPWGAGIGAIISLFSS